MTTKQIAQLIVKNKYEAIINSEALSLEKYLEEYFHEKQNEDDKVAELEEFLGFR